ncbi:MAG: carboxypeptidase-like regulatory domain-containing protein [Cyclobacteriaceae bacterium]|nr:carboxypeptidase-like regulatory domain-containing protein [Cyclobacteriaceae bacterium]
MRLLILTLILTVTFNAFGQRTIEGEVRLKDDNSDLPGVSIIEKGTDNRVNSNVDGKFRITCNSTNPSLEFSAIGLKTIILTADKDYMTVYLETDEEQLKEKIRFGIYPEYTSIGFNSGLNFTPIGVNLRNALPVIFGVKVLTTTDITYRTDLNKNKFINVRLQKDRLIDFSYNARHINLTLGYNKRNISKNNDNWNTEEFTIIPELEFDGFLFLLGYGRQSINNIETLKSNEGIVFGLGKYFNWNATLIGTAKKWNGYWQTEFQFIKGFDKNDFEFGIRFETLDTYREMDLMVLYRIHY